MEQKIKSVLELSRYKIGDILYWVVLRPIATSKIIIDAKEEWMMRCHPKTLHERGLIRAWRYKQQLPRLCSLDFQYVVDLLTSEPIVEKFIIDNIYRSSDTGEFYYANTSNEWMPESYLLRTAYAAKREKARIKQLFTKWASQISPDDI